MQRFPCPFCGLRDETEFFYAGDLGKVRPDTTQPVSDEEWSAYLNDYANVKGKAKEIWVHTACQEYLALERDTVTMDVLSVTQFRKGDT